MVCSPPRAVWVCSTRIHSHCVSCAHSLAYSSPHAGTAHAATWSAWRAKRGHEAAKDEANIDDAATAYARDVAAGFRHTATQPVAARAVGKAWPRAVHVVVVRVEKEVQASENVLTREEMYIFVLDLEPAAPAAAVCS